MHFNSFCVQCSSVTPSASTACRGHSSSHHSHYHHRTDFIDACMCVYIIYTPSTDKKRATLFLIITLAFWVDFLYFLCQWKQKGIFYKWANKIFHFTLTVSLHYLVKLKRCINITFWSKSLQCVRSSRLFTTFAESCPMFVFFLPKIGKYDSYFPIFGRKIHLSVFWQKNFHILTGF